MNSFPELVIQRRNELLYYIEKEYSEKHNFTIHCLNYLLPYDENIWNKNSVIIHHNSCMAKKNNNTQCMKKRINGSDFCKCHSKEINLKCVKCSNKKGIDVFHQFKWQIKGRIDDNTIYCS